MGMFSELAFLLGDDEDDIDYISALRLEYLNIGPVPTDETCVQVSNGDYRDAMRKEVTRYCEMLNRRFPNAPGDTEIVLKWFEHDFGSYAEAVVVYDPDDEESTRYAFFVESHTPMEWSDTAIIDWRA